MLLGQINLDGSRKVKLYISRLSGWRLTHRYLIGLKWVLTKDFGNFNLAIRKYNIVTRLRMLVTRGEFDMRSEV